MILNESDEKAVKRLRLAEQRWGKARWLMLVLGVLLIVISVMVGRELKQQAEAMVAARAQSDDNAIELFRLSVRAGEYQWFYFSGMVILFGCLIFWSGSPTRRLLLKFLDSEAQRQEVSASAPAPAPGAQE